MCLMIRGVSVLDVERSDLSTAFPFLGPCSLILCLLILGYFAINAIILHGQTAHFLLCGNVIIVVKTSSVAQRAICQLKAVIL